MSLMIESGGGGSADVFLREALSLIVRALDLDPARGKVKLS